MSQESVSAPIGPPFFELWIALGVFTNHHKYLESRNLRIRARARRRLERRSPARRRRTICRVLRSRAVQVDKISSARSPAKGSIANVIDVRPISPERRFVLGVNIIGARSAPGSRQYSLLSFRSRTSNANVSAL